MTNKLPEKKEKLLNAATQMFAELGFHDVKLDQVAGRAGVAKGTIYTYFKSKDALFCNCIFHESTIFNNRATKIIDSDTSFESRLKDLIALQHEFYRDKGTLVKQLMQLGPQLKLGVSEFNQGLSRLKEGVTNIARFFKQGLEAGILTSDLSPVQMAIVFIQVIDVNVLSELFGEQRLHQENVFRAMIKLFHSDPASIIK